MEIKGKTLFQSSLSKRQQTTGFIGVMLSLFIGSLYNTIVGTAMPRIITDLGGFSQYSWVFTSFMITQVVAIPLAGKLSDMYGRKWFYVAGISIFLTGSFLCGISQTMTQLIIFRGLQGLGFGVNMALSFIVIGDLFPPEERGKYHGILAGVFGVSTIIGPLLGGYLTDYLSWRWCFFFPLPFGIFILLLFIFFYPQLRPDYVRHKVDYAGTIAMALAIVPLMLALSWGGAEYGWQSPLILGIFVFSVAMFVIFFIIESCAEEPIIPLGLFKNRVVAVSSMTVFLQSFSFFSVISFIPLYFQGVLGTTAAMSGNFMVPMMFSAATASFICGQAISRTGGYYRLLSTIGFIVMAAGLFLLSRMTAETSFIIAVRNVILVGFGIGAIMPVHTIAVQNSVPYSFLGSATAMVNLMRNLGGLFGLSIVGSIINNRFSSQFAANLPPAVKEVVSPDKLASIVNNPQVLVNVEAQAQLHSLFEGLGTQGAELFEQTLSTLQNALSTALTQVFLTVFGVTILAMTINLFLTGITAHRRQRDEMVIEPRD
ncbi:MDR family MFS transporter [Chloroflexota bacterium]